MNELGTLNYRDLFLASAGQILGAGIFVLIGNTARYAGKFTYLSVFLAGLFIYFISKSYIKLSQVYNSNNAEFESIQDGFGKYFAKIIIMVAIFGSICSIYLVSKSFSSYASNIVDIDKQFLTYGVILTICGINLIGIKSVASLNNICFILGLSSLFGLIVVGLKEMCYDVFEFYANKNKKRKKNKELPYDEMFESQGKVIKDNNNNNNNNNNNDNNDNNKIKVENIIDIANDNRRGNIVDYLGTPTEIMANYKNILMGAYIIVFSYTGFEILIKLSDNAINPMKDIPKAMSTSIMFITAFYTLIALIYGYFVHINKTPICDDALSALSETLDKKKRLRRLVDVGGTILTFNTGLLTLAGVSTILAYQFKNKGEQLNGKAPAKFIIISTVFALLLNYLKISISNAAVLANTSIIFLMIMVTISIKKLKL